MDSLQQWWKAGAEPIEAKNGDEVCRSRSYP